MKTMKENSVTMGESRKCRKPKRILDHTNLVTLSTVPRKKVRAARALGKIGDPRAVNPLVKALEDPHPDVQTTAQKALAKLQEQKPRK